MSDSLYSIVLPNWEEINYNSDDDDSKDYELECIEKGIKFFKDNFPRHKKIHYVMIDSGYNHRIKWKNNNIYYNCNHDGKIQTHRNLVKNTNFEFRSDDLNCCVESLTYLVLQYIKYIKDLNFCVIFNCLSIDFIETEENGEIGASIICEMDSESG